MLDTGFQLTDSDFVLFDLPEQFALDGAELDRRWRAWQQRVHPDQHVALGAGAERAAMQWATRINEAHRRLKDPLARASYLCELRGAPLQAEQNTAMPAAFLQQQMDWREQLDDGADLDELAVSVAAEQRRLQEEVGRLLDVADAPQDAAAQVRAWMFLRRFDDELQSRLDEGE